MVTFYLPPLLRHSRYRRVYLTVLHGTIRFRRCRNGGVMGADGECDCPRFTQECAVPLRYHQVSTDNKCRWSPNVTERLTVLRVPCGCSY